MADTLGNVTTLAVLGALGVGALLVYKFVTGGSELQVTPGCERSWLCGAFGLGCPPSTCGAAAKPEQPDPTKPGYYVTPQPVTTPVYPTWTGSDDAWKTWVDNWGASHPGNPWQPIAALPGFYIRPTGLIQVGEL